MSPDVLLKNEFGTVKKSTFSDQSSTTSAAGISIVHSLFHATVSLYGGHVLSWQPINQKPVFWMSNDSAYGDGKAIRGGIPICFPWFGNFTQSTFEHTAHANFSDDEKSQLINHGFARTSLWELASIDVTEKHVKLVMLLKGENTNPAWKIPYEVKQELIIGESFSQQLFISNKSGESIEYTGALHSYFTVSSPSNTTIKQLSDVSFDDKLSGNKGVIQPLTNCVGPIDRIYYANNTMNIVDSGWNRRLQVTSFDCSQWVLWNPGKVTASKMADVHSGGENEYVCLEAANTQPIKIAANSTVKIGQLIEIVNGI